MVPEPGPPTLSAAGRGRGLVRDSAGHVLAVVDNDRFRPFIIHVAVTDPETGADIHYIRVRA